MHVDLIVQLCRPVACPDCGTLTLRVEHPDRAPVHYELGDPLPGIVGAVTASPHACPALGRLAAAAAARRLIRDLYGRQATARRHGDN